MTAGSRYCVGIGADEPSSVARACRQRRIAGKIIFRQSPRSLKKLSGRHGQRLRRSPEPWFLPAFAAAGAIPQRARLCLKGDHDERIAP